MTVLSLLLCALTLSAQSFAQTSTQAVTFTVPPLTGPVVDQAAMLSPQAQQRLDVVLRDLHQRGGSQIQLALLSDLGGLSIEEASIKIVDQWKLGGAKPDNGVLLLLAAKEHRIRIEVGQGLEGSLPDLKASRIIREVISPLLKQGRTDQAIMSGVAAIISYTDPDFSFQDGGIQGQRSGKLPLSDGLKLLLFLILFILFLRGGPFIGFFGGFGGGGGFGGSSGGGWSGGGGGFSGGGASGDW